MILSGLFGAVLGPVVPLVKGVLKPITLPLWLLLVAAGLVLFMVLTIAGQRTALARADTRYAKMEAQVAADRTVALQAAVDALELARVRQLKLIDDLAQERAKRQQEAQDAMRRISDLDTRLRTGSVRVRSAVCAAPGDLPVRRDAATRPGVDGGANGGTRPAGDPAGRGTGGAKHPVIVAIERGAKANTQLAGLQAYALSCRNLNAERRP